MEQHIVLRVVSKILLPFIFLFALYVQFHGDYGPGGGFQAGVIFAAGFILYMLIFGVEKTKKISPMLLLERIAPLGVLIYAGTGLISLLKGGKFLDYNMLMVNGKPASAAVAIEGQHLGIFLVELGVGITVTSVIVLIFFAFMGRGQANV